jgi:hypothetical protein
MKSLFDKNARYSERASQINEEIYDILKPKIRQYSSEGYSPREIEILMLEAICDITCSEMLDPESPINQNF